MLSHADSEQLGGYSRSPLLGASASFALGVAFAGRLPASLQGTGFFLGMASVWVVLGLLALRRSLRGPAAASLFLGFALAGSTASRLFEDRFPPNHVSRLATWRTDLREPVLLDGQIAGTPIRAAYGLQFDLKVTELETGGRAYAATGKVRVHMARSDDPEMSAVTESLHLEHGDSIRVLAHLRRPRVYENPGSFNYRRWLESIEDIQWQGSVESPLSIQKVKAASGFTPSKLIEDVRRRLLGGIDALYPAWLPEGRNGAVLKAVLLGDRSSLDSETIEDFRKTGLYHLLVIAGLHVGLITMLVGAVLRLFRARESTRTVAVLVFLLGYALLVEQRAPTLRATLMISTVLVARLLYREHYGLNAIGLAGLILLVQRPAWLFESGFQLSFSAALLIAGLVVPIVERTTEPFQRALGRLDDVERDAMLDPHLAQFRLDLRLVMRGLSARLPRLAAHPRILAALVTVPMRAALWAANLILFSAILQLGLLLPMAKTFHRVAFAGIGLNALAIPLMTTLLALALPTVLLSAVAPSLTAWLAKPLGLVMRGLFALTDLPRLPGGLSYRVPDPPLWVGLGFALSVIVAAWALVRHRRVFWAAFVAFGAFATFVCVHPFAPKLPAGMIEITALDCPGDAVVLVLPDRTTMLVGAGRGRGMIGSDGLFQRGRWNPGEDIVSPYLWSRGISKLDIVVLTPAHTLQLAGATAVVKNFRVREIWHPPLPYAPEYQALFDEARQRRTQIREVTAGEEILRGGVSINILWPPGANTDTDPSPAAESVVMRVARGPSSVLLASDISDKVERHLARSDVPLQSQVLKVVHHGDRSADGQFLARVSPQIALVVAENGNPAREPRGALLERFRAVGARVLRTDLNGALTIEINGSSLAAHAYRTSPIE